jgi:hypothetical protein
VRTSSAVRSAPWARKSGRCGRWWTKRFNSPPCSSIADCLPHDFDETALLGAVGVLVAWLIATASRAIIGEYFKRLWFNRVHPDEALSAQKRLAAAAAEVDRERAELASFRERVTDLITNNNDLRAEIIRLRIENAELLKPRA